MKTAWTFALLLALPAAGFGASAKNVFRNGRSVTGAPAARAAGGNPSRSRITYSQQRAASRNSAGMSRRSGFGRARSSGPSAPPSSQDQPPPAWATTPGALIRTQGLGFKEEAAGAAGVHSAEAGDRIVLEEGKSQALTNRPGLFTGPKDTPPPASPGTGGSASGRTAVTPNAPPRGD